MEFWHPNQLTDEPTLQTDEIHVWRASLQMDDSAIATLLPLLSADELTRANRFYFQKDRHRFIVARSRLRLILSHYLRLSPQALQFQYSQTGKPSLVEQPHLCFNLSHSHQLVLYAVAWNREVGIDVEKIRSNCECESIAARFFSAPEQSALNQLPSELKIQGFFNCWTRKEAFLKAIGKGLTLPLDRFAVSLASDEPARLLWADWELSPDEWSISNLDVGPEYAAAVAAAGQDWHLRGWQFVG